MENKTLQIAKGVCDLSSAENYVLIANLGKKKLTIERNDKIAEAELILLKNIGLTGLHDIKNTDDDILKCYEGKEENKSLFRKKLIYAIEKNN
ncbi:hypothetical protein COBT_001136 [Conglomerata obtusa]